MMASIWDPHSTMGQVQIAPSRALLKYTLLRSCPTSTSELPIKVALVLESSNDFFFLLKSFTHGPIQG